MKKTFLIFLLSLFSYPTFAQSSIQFKPEYRPNSRLVMLMETGSNMEMHFDGEKENLPDQLRERFPVKTSGASVLEESIVTGTKSSDASFPIGIFVQKQRKYISLNNSTMTEIPLNSGNLEGSELKGNVLANGNIQFISFRGDNVTPSTENIAKAVLTQMGNANALAGTTIQIGETISTLTPMQIPLKDNGAMSFKMETKRTLKSIEGDTASFDITYSAVVDTHLQAANIQIILSGDGKMTYSISKQYSPELTSEISTQMNIPIYGGKFIVITKGRSKTTTSYEPITSL